MGCLRNGSLPWWVLTTGIIAAAYLVVQAATATRLGVALFSVAVLTGQNVGSLLVDGWGRIGGTRIPATPRRVWGAVLSITAAVVAAAPYLSGSSPLLIPFLLAISVGGLAAVQFAMSGRVGDMSGDSIFSAWTLFGPAVATLALAAWLTGGTTAVRLRGWQDALQDQPWLLVGGLLGAAFVVITALMVPRVGVLVFGLTIILGQLLAGLLLDLFSGSLGAVVPTAIACALTLAAAWVASSGSRLGEKETQP